MPVATPETIGRYRVLKQLGEGHYGVVWLAEGEFEGGRRRVAVKQLAGEWSMRRFETLVHEYELLERVRHPSICRVYEFLDRENAVVLEYVEGETLRTLLERHVTFPAEIVARIGQELADCLYRAHESGLVHRDLKPENVMITFRGEIKLLDFGLAVGRGADDPGKGTPLYMAPEQARGEALTPASDLFALGLVLYELLTGESAHPVPSRPSGGRVEALFSRIERADFGERLDRLVATEPALGPIVGRCLLADPADRWPDGRTLLLALGEHARRASLGRFATLAFEGPERGRIGNPSEGSHSPMANPPDPIRPAGPPPPGGGNRPRPTAARPPPKPKMWAPEDQPPGAAGLTARPGGSAPAAPPPKPPGQDLAMVPLSQEEDVLEQVGSSSTSFFARPKPKKSANADGDEPIAALKRADPIAIAGGGAPAGAPPGAYAQQPMAPVAYAPPPMAAMPMTPMAPMMPLGIQGPVAGGGLPYGASPHSAQLPPDLQQDVQRAQSYRVFAVVLGLMFMVFSVTIVTVMVTVGIVFFGNPSEGPKEKEVAVGPISPVAPPPLADTGGDRAPPPPIPTPATGPKPKVQPSGPKPPPAPRPPPEPAPSAGGQVTITLQPGSPPFLAVEVKCPGGFRDRGEFVGGVAKIPGVPSESCDAAFKGGPPAKTKVSGGDAKSCSFEGGGAVANCR